LVCQAAGNVSVCAKGTKGADDSGGCSLSRAGAPSAPLGYLLAIAGAGASLMLLRRRR